MKGKKVQIGKAMKHDQPEPLREPSMREFFEALQRAEDASLSEYQDTVQLQVAFWPDGSGELLRELDCAAKGTDSEVLFGFDSPAELYGWLISDAEDRTRIAWQRQHRLDADEEYRQSLYRLARAVEEGWAQEARLDDLTGAS